MGTSSANKRAASAGSAYEYDIKAQSGPWPISYSDLITTLMVLFLALYALQLASYKELEMKTFQQRVARERTKGALAQAEDATLTRPDTAKQQLLALMGPLRDTVQLTIAGASHGTEIAISAKVLLYSGDACLLPESVDVLNRIAVVLRDHSTNNILGEGHTDNAPISAAKYETSWELSSARVGSVVRFFADKGIEARRMAAIGRADNFPSILGDSAAARAANCRVTILVED
ncbi:OmpA family protein [Paraburkholderia sp. RL17-383-BIF-A]|uniref:OmpA family protein n=1 Tax=Paraburkholderia sp. RL17-383-BIF-A TaxID=3031631 RepID=UPI0038BC2481